MKLTIKRTQSSHLDFITLVNELNAELAEMNGEEDRFFNQFNKVNNLQHVAIAYLNDDAIACGAFKVHSPDTIEIKRMYVLQTQRNQGVAQEVLKFLESWASELGFKNAILETGNPHAVKLYKKCGYEIIPNYDQYIGIESSICMRKEIEMM